MTLSMVRAALVNGGRLVLIGRNDAGIKSAGRHLSEIVGENEVLDFRFHARAISATVAREEVPPIRAASTGTETVFGAPL